MSISIEDILNDIEVVRQKEAVDKTTLEGIATISAEELRQRLVSWATQGFPNAWTLQEVVVQPPAQCSDGVARNLADYITFVSGKTIGDHIADLQTRLTGITVGYAWSGYAILIVVTKT